MAKENGWWKPVALGLLISVGGAAVTVYASQAGLRADVDTLKDEQKALREKVEGLATSEDVKELTRRVEELNRTTTAALALLGVSMPGAPVLLAVPPRKPPRDGP